MGPYGYVGAGIIDGVVGISDMVVKKPDKSTWIVNKIETYINNMAEYLICQFKEIMGEYFEEYMGQDDLKHFNTAMTGLQSYWMMTCPTRRCLNQTQTDPPKRIEGCCTLEDNDSSECKGKRIIGSKGWEQVKCMYGDSKYGVCGSDNGCYHCYDFDRAAEDAQYFINRYIDNSYLNFGASLAKYDGTDAFIAEAKSATFIIMIYQHLHLLGAGTNPNGDMVVFAETVST